MNTQKTEFTLSHPAFLEGIQRGEALFRLEYRQATFLTDLDLLEFYRKHLSPFARDPIKHTGSMLGWIQALLATGILVECVTGNLDVLAGYHIAAHDWQRFRKDDLLTDTEFGDFLAIELAPSMLAAMHAVEPWYTEAYQIGYAFGLVRALLLMVVIKVKNEAGALNAHEGRQLTSGETNEAKPSESQDFGR
ncbi:MAG TPA: hypothetical protein VFV38_13345 [Ktedonobacteraceae bacterium]|nr:hypothetical protein [Ktedonobacteraceae bacterium]